MEGYTMFQDGYVVDVQGVRLPGHTDYVAVKAKVHPRTKDKDPVTKTDHYVLWIVFACVDISIRSGHCTCKGGSDGACRHVVAALFELAEYLSDWNKRTVTSEPCVWRHRSEGKHLTGPVPIADINTSIVQRGSDRAVNPSMFVDGTHTTQLPSAKSFIDGLASVQPAACMLDAYQCRPSSCMEHDEPAPLTVRTVAEKFDAFKAKGGTVKNYDGFLSVLQYSEEEREAVEVATRGQSRNRNWHAMRQYMLTASAAKKLCCSTNCANTAALLVKGPSLVEEHLPAPIVFGRKYESRALDALLKAHRYSHRKCTVKVPGLIMSSAEKSPFIACSPDGIVNCKSCGEFLVEIKCLWKYRYMHPTPGGVLSGIVSKDNDNNVTVVPTHQYYYQVQMQMGVTGIHKCYLVLYTHKGISPVAVPFDSTMWNNLHLFLCDFYEKFMFPLLMS